MRHWESMMDRVEEYLRVRRSLGYKLKIEGGELHRFAQFAEKQKHSGPITVELAVAWAKSSKKDSQLFHARRIETLRGLTKFCALFEQETEIPSPKLLGRAHRRISPYIYTPQEILELIDAAGQIEPQGGLRPETMRHLIGLLSATGLRISEALYLNRTDVDLDHGYLLIRETKFNKSRYVPLHPTAVQAMYEYTDIRERKMPFATNATAFFLNGKGAPFQYRQALYAFQSIRRRLGWEKKGKRPPRLHDLRHTFACRRLLAWYEQGIDINRAILYLSVYLGHYKVTDTYWYLTGIPSLMAIAAERFEDHFAQGGSHA